MKCNYTYIIVFTFFLLFAWSCTDGQEEMSGGGGKEQGQKVTLALNSLPLQGSGTVTRSEGKGMDLVLGSEADAETRAVEDENRVSNLCVFQFEGALGSSSAVLIGKTYASGLTSITFPLILESFTGQCFLYVCANVGDITGDYTVKTSTYQDIQNASYRISGQGDFDVALPMSGCSGQLVGNVVTGSIGISLTRMVAKVSFTCNIVLPAGDAFTITNAKLCNAPQTADYVFSDGNANAVGVDSHIGKKTSSTQTTATYVWYMPESKRGTKRGATSWADRIEKNAPLYASYIELTGIYTYSLGDKKTTTEVTYAIYLGNGTDYTNYDVERNHHYQITSTIKGMNIADRRVTTDTNLSADGLANCYLAGRDNHWYRFNGTVRGNGNSYDYAKEFCSSSMLPADGVNIENINDAVVIWETAQGLINDVEWNAASRCVKFRTGTEKGNALIAVRNAAKEVLWSWHIWRTNDVDLATLNEKHALNIKTNTTRPFYTSLDGAVGRVRNLTILDRNIGAAFNGEPITINDNVDAYNLFYQFGRKDPFPGGAINNAEILLYGYRDGTQVTFRVSEKKRGTSAENAMATIERCIKTPEMMLNNGAAPANWISSATVNTADWEISNSLWGDNNMKLTVPGNINTDGDSRYIYVDSEPWDGEKTIYDPSPAGWRVAPADTWTGITNTETAIWGQTAIGNIYHTNTSWENGWWVYFNGDPSVKTFIPASGYRVYYTSALADVSTKGYTWFSSPAGRNSIWGSFLYILSTYVGAASQSNRAQAYPVRCARYSVGK